MDSIAAAKLELSIRYTAEETICGLAAYTTRPGEPEEQPPASLDPPATFPSRSGCTLTMTFEYENAAPACHFRHRVVGCRCRPGDRMLGALPLTNYLIRVLVRDSQKAQEPHPMTHQRAWRAMADVLLHSAPASTGVSGRYSWQTRLRVKAVALELMWLLDPASEPNGGGGALSRALGRFAMNITAERKAQEPGLARTPRLLADLAFAPVDSPQFGQRADQLMVLGQYMVDAAEQYDERAREWFVRLLTGFNIAIFDLVADRCKPTPEYI